MIRILRISSVVVLLFAAFSMPMFTSAITVEVSALVEGCGDGAIGVGESCDGANLGGASCASQGFAGGTLSCTASCTLNTSACTTGVFGGGGGSGGGGGIISIPTTNIVFTGRAYPLSKVFILKDGQIALSTIAGPDSNFSVTLSGLSSGNYTFSLYAEDSEGHRSTLFTFPVFVTSSATTKISGIFVPPTISLDKSQVKKGDTLTIFGQSAPSSRVVITVNSLQEHFLEKETDKDGIYLALFDTTPLEVGDHTARSKTLFGGEITPFSRTVGFSVGSQNVFTTEPQLSIRKGDLNGDGRVNLVDFSIAAFWYKKELSEKFKVLEGERLNGDQKVTLADFSIMAFYWTG